MLQKVKIKRKTFEFTQNLEPDFKVSAKFLVNLEYAFFFHRNKIAMILAHFMPFFVVLFNFR